jgi:hypothetical protein
MKGDLKNLSFQLNQNKGKEKREAICCTTCRTEGHHKKKCLTFMQYMATGAPNPFPIRGPWCNIFKNTWA